MYKLQSVNDITQRTNGECTVLPGSWDQNVTFSCGLGAVLCTRTCDAMSMQHQHSRRPCPPSTPHHDINTAAVKSTIIRWARLSREQDMRVCWFRCSVVGTDAWPWRRHQVIAMVRTTEFLDASWDTVRSHRHADMCKS